MSSSSSLDLASLIREVPDFPRPGILFRDVTPLLADSGAFEAAIDAMAEPWTGSRVTAVAAIEARGFIFGGGIAERLSCGLIPIRKPGKLPRATRRQEYMLEYGLDALEIHANDLDETHRVLVVDDVLATGGTAAAACSLVRSLGATVVGTTTLIELRSLRGREQLDSPFNAPISYD